MRIFLLVVLCASTLLLAAQPPSLTGRIVTASGEPVAGATIAIRGTHIHTVSSATGHFQLTYPTLPLVLVVTHVNYTSREYPVQQVGVLNIPLTAATAGLDEVIVQGYGTTTRRYATGNIGKVSATAIGQQPVTNPLAALQGRVPGVLISTTSGVPGAEMKIEIRGRSSLDATLSRNDPLFVIDGVPFEPGNNPATQIASAAGSTSNAGKRGLSPLNSINPADIESIEVLKDADATAIYGSRGANGVILITTKKAGSGKSRLQVNLSAGGSTITRMTDLLSTQQYLQMRREGLTNDGQQATPANAPDLLRWDTTRFTDLKKLLIGNTARHTSVQATLSGGTAATQYSVSGSYNRQTNVFSRELTDEVRSARFTMGHTSPDKKLSLQFAALYSSDKNQLLTTDLTQYLNLPPNIKLYDSLGNLAWEEGGTTFTSLNITNPLSLLLRRYTAVTDNLSGNLTVSYSLLPGLQLRSSMGYNSFSLEESSQVPKAAIAPTQPVLPSAQLAGSSSKSYILEPQIEYKRRLGSGQFTLLTGATWQDRSNSGYQISASNYTNDLLLGSVAAGGTISANNRREQYRYSALFGRVNYTLQNRYVLNLSGRRDASSRFGPDKRMANFGAAGAAWIFSETRWMRSQLPFVSFGKLRGSYGITGNDQIGNYKYLDLWSSTLYPYQGVGGLYPSSLFNPDYAWEINKKAELALDLGFWKERLQVSAAYYRNRCSNQLVSYRLPSQTGFDAIGRNLPALVQNSGLEALVSGTVIRKEAFSWSAALNVTLPRNKLLSFPGLATSAYATTYREGEPLSLVYAYEYLGVNPQTGMYTYRDVDGNGVINSRDRLFLGNTEPSWYGGVQQTLRYKGLECSIFLEFRKRQGRSYLDGQGSFGPGYLARNQPVLVLDRWQQKGDIAAIQRFTALSSSAATAAANLFSLSSGLYTDASYLRCKNLSIAYALPAAWLQRIHLQSGQVFLHGQNLFVLTPYKGADPETQNLYTLPPLRTLVAGIQFQL